MKLASYLSMALMSSVVWVSSVRVDYNPRYLVWPPGAGNKLQIICGFGVPIDAPKTSLTYGLILKTNYVLPNNATYFTEPYVAFARRSVGASRWHLYKVVEALLSRLDLGGRSCLLRSVCEAAETPVDHNGLMGELLHILLTFQWKLTNEKFINFLYNFTKCPTSTEDEPIDESARLYYAAETQGRALNSNGSHNSDCSQLYPDCQTGLLDFISTLISTDSLLSLL